MKRKLCLIFIILLHYCENGNGLRLKKVVILSRHGLRGPISENIETLTPKTWPKSTASGQLSSKGALLESYMSKYFSAWFHEKGLFHDRCPESNSVYIYSNYGNRTRDTAKAFTRAAFPNCNITLNSRNVTLPNPKYDPIFPFILTNATDAYLQSGRKEMQEKLNKINLADAYARLNIISDIRNSEICRNEGVCDLTKGKDEVIFNVGDYPHVAGRFDVANLLVDALLMVFYEGLPVNKFGWGDIKSDWKLLIKIVNEYLNICHNLTTTREFIRPLVEYIKKVIEDDTLFTLIVGHDSNINRLMVAMGFKPHVLPEQFESIPIGSKLVFQKWTNGVDDFLKVEYVYQSWRQIRYTKRLSLSNPPKNITLHFEKYNADENGMYLWSDFEKILDEAAL